MSAKAAAPPSPVAALMKPTSRDSTASPPEAKQQAPEPALRSLERRDPLTETALRKQLAWVPHVRSLSLNAMSDLARAVRDSYREGGRVSGNVDLGPARLLEVRADLAYLPIRRGNACRLNAQSAATLDVLSRKLHALLDVAAPQDMKGRRPTATVLAEILHSQTRGQRLEWLRPQAIPVLLQILMHEDASVRRILVELLAEIPGDASSVALAQRAIFDLSPEVRERALRALQSRPPGEYRQVLVGGLRYPWAPVADHAAEAMVFLDDRDDVSVLVTLLKKSDPAAPAAAAGSRPYLRELVQIDHAANCMMCHAPSTSGSDPARGPVPGVLLAGGGSSGPGSPGWRGGGGAGQSVNSFFVRADVAYLRQDFSIDQPVADPSTGLEAILRFDFLVRVRPAKAQEIAARQAQSKKTASYPQRDAVLFALRELTGKDAGPTTDAWLALFPRAELDAQATALSTSLVQATARRQAQLLAQFKSAQGEVYTQALARAIPNLKGPTQDKAREVLLHRLSQLNAEMLTAKLADHSAEIRRAAARIIPPVY
jgi:HEAT repeats